ncbi:hypothetical protein NL529_29670, partial [Klebsiella pneumoniae]|nr:hypothetical protein [Klebsiella pneumoniae]
MPTQPVEPVPVASAGATGAVATGNPSAGGSSKSIGAGTAFTATTGAELCSLANRPGDKIVATLTADVTGPDGARLPAGTPV